MAVRLSAFLFNAYDRHINHGNMLKHIDFYFSQIVDKNAHSLFKFIWHIPYLGFLQSSKDKSSIPLSQMRTILFNT